MLYVKATEGHSDTYLKVDELLTTKTTNYGTISIVKLKELGKTLMLDNELQSSDYCQADYHQNLVFPHSPLEGEKALVLGAGEGVSTHLLTICGYKDITSVDIDETAIKLYEHYLSDWNKGIYSKERQHEFKLVIDDALSYIKTIPKATIAYIVFDLDSKGIGQSTDEYFKEFARVLIPGGVVSAQDGPHYLKSLTLESAKKYFKEENINCSFSKEEGWRFLHSSKCNQPETKSCAICKNQKLHSEFNIIKSSGYLHSYCKPCLKNYRKEKFGPDYDKNYYLQNKKKIIKYQREYFQENREKVSTRTKNYYFANQEKMAEARKAWRAKNPEAAVAHSIVNSALVNKPAACLCCDADVKLELHHHKGYAEPFKGLWICRTCHKRHHGSCEETTAKLDIIWENLYETKD